MWTIHDLEVLFHHYCSIGPWPKGQTDAYRNSIHKLWVYEMLDSKERCHVTPKGCAFIDMLRNTPAPEQGWYDPRVKEDAA
jgi:hypothetical protein